MKAFFKKFIKLYTKYNIPTSSAGLAYFITMSLFPTLIIMYVLLGKNSEVALVVLDSLTSLIPKDTMNVVANFINYVADNYNNFMFILAVSVIIITASAGFRSLSFQIGRIQGGRRFTGFGNFIASIIMAVLLIVVFYIAAITMLTGSNLFHSLLNILKISFESSVFRLRYVFMFFATFLIICLLFLFCRKRNLSIPIIPGAITTTVALVLVSWIFALFIEKSAKYPILYGSLQSIILLMFWLYCCGQSIYLGAIVNTILKDKNRRKTASKEKKENEDKEEEPSI